MTILENQLLIEGIHYKSGKPISIQVENGRISSIEAKSDKADKDLPWIGPGFVDLQLNGHIGHNFHRLPYQEGMVLEVISKLWSEGVTSFFPAIGTNSDESIEEVMRSIAKACAEDTLIRSVIQGIHLEGPFISPEEGPRGAHSNDHVKAPDWDLFQRWQEAADGKIKLLTLSPEWSNAIHFISKCVENGITVSIGHTSATAEQIKAAVSAGARMSTHLGNGAHVMLPRHPNYIWEQLAQDELWPSIIADGFHLPDSVLKVIIKTKGEKVFIVSDANYISGQKPGTYVHPTGLKVVLTEEGRIYPLNNPNILAGSAQLIKWGVEHLLRRQLCTLSEAWEMASVRPSAFMNLPSSKGITIGSPADLVLFDWTGDKINVRQTYKDGNLMYGRVEKVSL